MPGRGDGLPATSDEVTHRIHTRGVILAGVLLGLLATASPALAAPAVHRITLDMREFAFQPAALYLKAGERVELVIENRGAVEHEWSAGRGLVDLPYEKGFRTDLLAILKPRVSGRGYDLEQLMTTNLDTKESVEGETVRRLSREVDVAPGGRVVLDFTVPRAARGRWRMGCFLPGQYESGMYGVIEVG